MKEEKESFGLKMLKKMGWEKGKKIGKNPISYMSTIKEIKKRKKGLGLGADNKQAIKNADENNKEKKINTEYKLFQKILVINGKHKDMKGIIKKIEEENLIIEINHKNIKIQKNHLKILTINNNKKEKEKYKEKTHGKKIENDKKINQNNSKINQNNSQKINQNNPKNNEKKSQNKFWVRNDLKIRVRSKKFKNGIYYLKKGSILDMYDGSITLLIDNNIVKGFKEKYLETLLPKIGGDVLVVKGRWENKIGKLMKRDKKKNKVVVFLGDIQNLVSLTQNEVCGFIN